jgi:hypothetical protein
VLSRGIEHESCVTQSASPLLDGMLRVLDTVQGVGFRPFVLRLIANARSLDRSGIARRVVGKLADLLKMG